MNSTFGSLHFSRATSAYPLLQMWTPLAFVQYDSVLERKHEFPLRILLTVIATSDIKHWILSSAFKNIKFIFLVFPLYTDK